MLLDARGTEPYMQVTALPGLNGKLRKQCLHLLYKICKDREMLPTSYLLQQESLHADSLHRRGGFADVSEGGYLGRRVAIKVLRFGTKDASNSIFKVPNSSATGYFITVHFVNSNSVGKSLFGKSYLIQTSCHCWGCHSLRAPIPSTWPLLG